MAEDHRDAPIAIVGIGLRFPQGNDSLEGFARFLRDGRSGIGKAPGDRFTTGVPDDVCTDGGYLDSIDRFDAGFFGMSPREAAFVDPQHRLTLELAWEALENAGIDPTSLRHSDTGVYVALTNMDYAVEIGRLPMDQIEMYAATGMFHCGASGRVSYFMGLRGPSISVDGACASSLVAVHLAVQALRAGECGLALCGATQTISDSIYPVLTSRSGVLSPDALCKTFDDAGNGYVRGEGAAVIALKRLDDARRDGDRVLAVIRGSAVRQDGESAGLMVPNGKAQTLLMRAALRDAGLSPADLQYVEAHGTGTPMGDPIELGGITEVFADSHSHDNPILVGSVKTNIGHLEAASGMAGLVKTVLQLQEGTFYPHLNFTTPSRKFDWDRSPVKVPVEPIPWAADGGTRRALVNSYGATGTIASVVLEEPPATDRAPRPEQTDTPAVFTLSAKSEAALRRQLDAYADFVAGHDGVDLSDLCYTSNVGRAHHAWRVSAAVANTGELGDFLDRQRRRTDWTRPSSGRKNVALMFPGGGTQYEKMGLSLYRRFPVFREHIDRCSELFSPLTGFSVTAGVLGETEGGGAPTGAAALGARLFSLEYALAKLWLSFGVRPSVLIGHSLGEIVAATVAGVFSLEDAVRIVAARGHLLDKTSPGTMAAVRASRAQVEEVLAGFPDVALGAVNGPEQCVVSGAGASVTEIASLLEARGVEVTRLRMPVASHSPLMDEIAGEYRSLLEQVEFREPEFAVASTVLGRVARQGEMTKPDHWVRHLCDTVRFDEAMGAVEERGRHVFVEVGPGAELLGMGRACAKGEDHLWLGSMHRDDPHGNTLRHSVSRLYNAGLPVSWQAWHRGAGGNRVALPTYAFDRTSYWLPSPRRQVQAVATVPHAFHPLLGEELPGPVGRAADARSFEARVSASHPAYLAEHQVNGAVTFPGSGFVEMLLALSDALLGSTDRPIEDLRFHEPLVLTGEHVTLHTYARPDGEGFLRVEVGSRSGSGARAAERRHVSARVRLDAEAVAGPRAAADALRRAPGPDGTADAVLMPEDVSAHFRRNGLTYGPTFATLRQATRHSGPDSRATVVGVVSGRRATPVDFLHPALLAGVFQSSAGLPRDPEAGDNVLVVTDVERAVLLRKPRGTTLRSVLKVTREDEGGVIADLGLYDEDDSAVFCATGVTFVRASSARPAPERTEAPGDHTVDTRSDGTAPFDLEGWRALPADRRHTSASAFLLDCLAEVLHFPDPGEIPEGASFFELGMDSLTGVQLKTVVEAAFQVRLTARLIVEHPTVDALAALLVAGTVPENEGDPK
ncbi:type I polyketide synthase [Streptomyces sp. NPDC055607]